MGKHRPQRMQPKSYGSAGDVHLGLWLTTGEQSQRVKADRCFPTRSSARGALVMVRSRQVTILAIAGSVAKNRLLRLACEAIERICEMGDVWSGPACTRPMRGTGPLSEALRGASILPSRVAPRTRRRICSWNRLFFRMRAQTVIQQRAG